MSGLSDLSDLTDKSCCFACLACLGCKGFAFIFPFDKAEKKENEGKLVHLSLIISVGNGRGKKRLEGNIHTGQYVLSSMPRGSNAVCLDQICKC